MKLKQGIHSKPAPRRALGLLCAAALLAGCASTRNAVQPVIEQKVEVERTPVTIFTDDEPLFTDMAKSYGEQNEPLKITLEFKRGEDAAKSLRDRLLAGNAPDLVYLSYESDNGVYEALAADKGLYDLSALIKGEGAPQFYTGFLGNPITNAYGDDVLTGVPLQYFAAGLIGKPERIAKLLPAGTTLKQAGDAMKEGKLLGYPQDYPAYLEPLILPLFGAAGGTVRSSTEDYASGAFSSPEMQKAAAALQELSGCVYTKEPQADRDSVYTAFKDDEILLLPGDASLMETLRASYGVSGDLAFYPVPGADGDRYLLTRFSTAYVPSMAAHPEQGLKFLQYLLSSAQLDAFLQSGGYLPPLQGASGRLQGAEQSAALLFEDGILPFLGTFAEDPETDAVLLEEMVVGASGLLRGNADAKDWGERMDSLLEKRAQRIKDAQETASSAESSSAASSDEEGSSAPQAS